MVIEMNGVAGCGKTTAANKLCSDLNDLNIKAVRLGVEEFNKRRSNKLLRLLNKLRNTFAVLSPSCISLFILLLKRVCVSKTKKECTESYYELFVNIAYICFLNRSYKKYRRNIVVVDEGIIQSLTAFVVSTKYSSNIFQFAQRVLSHFAQDIYRIDFNLSIEQVLSRIKTRNRTEAAIDYLNEEELFLFLSEFINNVKWIRTMSDVLDYKKLAVVTTECLYCDYQKILNEIVATTQRGQ